MFDYGYIRWCTLCDFVQCSLITYLVNNQFSVCLSRSVCLSVSLSLSVCLIHSLLIDEKFRLYNQSLKYSH